MAEMSIESRSVQNLLKPDGRDKVVDPASQKQVMEAVKDVQKRVSEETSTEAKKEREQSQPSVAELVAEINKAPSIRATSLQFVFEERSDPPVVEVIDKSNGEKIRQIPSELAVKLAKAIAELSDNNTELAGFLFDKQI